jgi:hypothetical protein
MRIVKQYPVYNVSAQEDHHQALQKNIKVSKIGFYICIYYTYII